MSLCGQDRRLVDIWRKHGIPCDRSTCEAALDIINRLDSDLAEAWKDIDNLTEEIPCGECGGHLSPLSLTAACDDCGTMHGPARVTS